jgi:hypothetical protein
MIDFSGRNLGMSFDATVFSFFAALFVINLVFSLVLAIKFRRKIRKDKQRSDEIQKYYI